MTAGEDLAHRFDVTAVFLEVSAGAGRYHAGVGPCTSRRRSRESQDLFLPVWHSPLPRRMQSTAAGLPTR